MSGRRGHRVAVLALLALLLGACVTEAPGSPDDSAGPSGAGGRPSVTVRPRPPATVVPIGYPPYAHVTEADVGVSIGTGVVGPEPVVAYEGSLDIDEPTVIADVVIDGCVNVRADDVVLRNVVIRCVGWHGVANLDRSFTQPVPIRGLVVEHSRIECSAGELLGKMFRLDDVTDVAIRENELIGCDQTFFLGGVLDGLVIERNLQRDPIIDESSHWEAISLGEDGAVPTSGTVVVRGNRFSTGGRGGGAGITDVVFAPMDGGGELSLYLESNFFPDANEYTIRCNPDVPGLTCSLDYNVFDDTIRRFGGVGLGLAGSTVRCNRFADGELVSAPDSAASFEQGVIVDDVDCPPAA